MIRQAIPEGSASSAPLILDLGANIGIASLRLLDLFPTATVHAFEPDPLNAASLMCCLRMNGLENRCPVKQACASTETGVASFRPGLGSGSALVLEPGGVGHTQVPAVDVLPLMAEADIVKMDIEGGEWPILTDPRFRSHRPRALVMEYHRYGCPERSLDRLAPDPNPRILATTLLREAGFTVIPVRHNAWGHGVLWAWRESPETSSPDRA